MSKEINELHEKFQPFAQAFLQKCKEMDFPVKVYFTYRSIDEQNDLYAKGRTMPGPKVTNAKGGESYHNYGLAFDAAPLKNGLIDWDDAALFLKMGKIGEQVGLEWGGSWTFKDFPHFQKTFGLSIADLKGGKRP